MNSALQQFQGNVRRIHDLHALCIALQNLTTQAIDIDDIFRAEIIMIVSALDTYVHEVVRLGILECFSGARAKTQAYMRFRISLDTAERLLSTSNYGLLDLEIREQHSWKSFQASDKIADAIRLISDTSLWEEVAKHLILPPKDVKDKLNLIVDRRNKIAHEADTDPTYGTLWHIDAALVEDSVGFISSVVEAIHQVL